MAELKTKPSQDSVTAFLADWPDPAQQADALALQSLMAELSGQPAVLWGKMVGFGTYHYRYASGHEGDSFRIGFALGKQKLTVYILPGFERFAPLMEKLGKYKTGKSCLYLRRLADIDPAVLRALIQATLAYMAENYPEGTSGK